MKRIAGLIAALAATGLLVGCGGSEESNEIPIAVVGPVTGQYASFGQQMKNGGEMAVDDINEAGGVLGKKLDFTMGDDACDPKQAVAVANQITGQGVALVAGHYCSGSSIPASQVYGESDMVQISPASTNPDFTDKRSASNIYRVCGRDDQQGGVAGKYLATHYGDKNIAIIHDKTAYGKGFADEVKKALNETGKEEVLYEAISAGEKDYSALVSKLKQAQADVVYFGGLHTEAGLIIRQMRDQGLNAPLMSGDGIVSAEFVSIAGPGAEGTLMTFAPDPRKNPNAKDVVAKFKAKNFEPEAYTLYSYAAVQILAEAAKQANSTDGKKIAEVMKQGKPFKTVIGDISYDKKGDITRPDYVMYTWKKGADGKIDYTGNEMGM